MLDYSQILQLKKIIHDVMLGTLCKSTATVVGLKVKWETISPPLLLLLLFCLSPCICKLLMRRNEKGVQDINIICDGK